MMSAVRRELTLRILEVVDEKVVSCKGIDMLSSSRHEADVEAH
jgi:hypothetical protein